MGGNLTDLSLSAAEGGRSEAAVFVYGDPVRKVHLRVLVTHLAAAKHGSLRLQKISWLQPRCYTPTSHVTVAQNATDVHY